MISAALHKTCITSVPIEWGAGFHAASVYPRFGGLYLLHLKFAEIASRVRWHERMLDCVKADGSEQIYFSDGDAKLAAHKEWLSAKSIKNGWESLRDAADEAAFLSSVEYGRLYKTIDFYQGKFTIGTAAFVIPDEFSRVI